MNQKGCGGALRDVGRNQETGLSGNENGGTSDGLRDRLSLRKYNNHWMHGRTGHV